MSRKNSLFAGSDEGGANWAIIGSLIDTAKLVNRWPQSRIDDLMPWADAKIPA